MLSFIRIALMSMALWVISNSIHAQKYILKGTVTIDSVPAIGTVISVRNTSIGTQTDINGSFELSIDTLKKITVQIRSVDTNPFDTTLYAPYPSFLEIKLKPTTPTTEIVITGSMQEITRQESVSNIEVYNSTFFKKNPTANLFDALQNVNGVRPQLNCNICNTGDIHINGLEGPYTLILIDGMPIVSGLSTVYGLMGIPTSLIERMEISKGPSSTLYGSEAIGGVINIITKSPNKAPRLFVDVSSTSQFQKNIDLGIKNTYKKITALTGVNYHHFNNKIDLNKDNFTDITLQHRISVFQKLSIERKEDRKASLAGRYMYEDRMGGELNWTRAFRGGDSIYGESIYTSRWELIGAYDLPIKKQKIQLQGSFNNHNQNAAYGQTFFIAKQRISFGQMVWFYKKGKNDLVSGISVRHTYYDDNTAATTNGDTINPQNKVSSVLLPGLFTQNTYSISPHTQCLGGIRMDHHPIHGMIYTPRVGVRWAQKDTQSIRLNIGSGFRVVSIFTEEHAALTGARKVVIENELKPEKSWNANLNYLRYFYHKNYFLLTDLTLFYTYFTNKIIPDYLSNPNEIRFNNIDGYAVSKGITLNTECSFTNGLKINVGFTVMNVFSKQKNTNGEYVKQQQLLTEHFNGTYSVSYTVRSLGLSIDYTGNLYSPMKLPVQPNDFRPEYSPWWSIQNIQVTKKMYENKLEVYFGVKNLLNFLPTSNIIMRPQDPFDKNVNDPINNPNGYTFDTSYMYAPYQGIRGFLGLRLTLN